MIFFHFTSKPENQTTRPANQLIDTPHLIKHIYIYTYRLYGPYMGVESIRSRDFQNRSRKRKCLPSLEGAGAGA
ncbi:hypothetical protein Hanom_Chr10g00964841 [Helianthus anomalus]